jgi:hypothetical protein
MFGMDNMISELMSNKLEETLAVIRQVMEQFQNPVCFVLIKKFIFIFILKEFNNIYLCLYPRIFIII